MTGEFGKYIEERRKNKGITLRGLATLLEIAPAYMSDIEKSKRISPTLSTVNQQLYDQGKEAAKLALDVAMGNSVEHATQIKLTPCYRQSCGCVPMDATLPNSEQISKEGIFTMNDVLDARVFQSTVNYFLDRMQNTETLENFYKKFQYFVFYNETIPVLLSCIVIWVWM